MEPALTSSSLRTLAAGDRARAAWLAFLDLEPVRLFVAEWLEGPYALATSGGIVPIARLPRGPALERVVLSAQADVFTLVTQLIRLGDEAPGLTVGRRFVVRVDPDADKLAAPLGTNTALSERVQALVILDYLVRPAAFREELGDQFLPRSHVELRAADATQPLPPQ